MTQDELVAAALKRVNSERDARNEATLAGHYAQLASILEMVPELAKYEPKVNINGIYLLLPKCRKIDVFYDTEDADLWFFPDFGARTKSLDAAIASAFQG